MDPNDEYSDAKHPQSLKLKSGLQVMDKMLNPIQDTGLSPSIMIQNKRQFFDAAQKQPELGRENHQRNNQVNYSFGQQPFKDGGTFQTVAAQSSGQNSMRLAAQSGSSPGTFRPNGGNLSIEIQSKSALANQQVNYTSMASESGNAQSKDQKSAVSMASVMGQFETQPNTANGVPNIFAQSMQHQQQQSRAQKQSPLNVNNIETRKRQSDNNIEIQSQSIEAELPQTAQNFVKTADRIESVEKLVSDGLSKGAHRQSQHSLEAIKLGVRKSIDGGYEEVNPQKVDNNINLQNQQTNAKVEKNITQKLIQKASLLVEETVNKAIETKVPDAIRNQMLQQGFRPSSKTDGQFEYESDSVEIYEMISNEFDYEEVRKLENFGIKQYKDCIYRGQLNDNRQREGLGVLVYQKGRVYEGEWIKNKRSGRGYEIFTSGNSYHGSYDDGKPNGKGVYQWQNGEVYDGEWLQGIKHGYGVWKGSNGESYIGQWVQSKAQGYGVHVFANGDKYEGEWHECLREGNGSDFFANGDCYVGQYANGKPEGFGQYKWKNGSSYTGQFLNGLKHGNGKWKKKANDEYGNQKCNLYDGMYQEDKKHGYGIFEWESGNRYQGNYQNDERHGYGEMKWTDESMYMGMWDQGIQHGVGVMIFPDGVRRAGIFEENVFKESLKRRDQLQPYRELLNQDCLQILDEVIAQREQSNANLFGPSDMNKAELLQNDLNNADLNLDSNIVLPRDSSESRQQSIKSSGMINPYNNNAAQALAHDNMSDNASVINKPMRNVEKEDLTQTMQKQNPMNNFQGGNININMKNNENLQQMHSLPPLPATSSGQIAHNNHGRTIEVQTELSMVTMEQYSQGNSNAFNRTQGFERVDQNAPEGQNIQIQNEENQSRKDFQHVLSKANFQDTKHQQEILGGGNPNEDTESEWNRNNSSMMVTGPTKFLNGTLQSRQESPAVRNNFLGVKNQQVGNRKPKRSIPQKNNSLPGNNAAERRFKSNDQRKQTQELYTSPYAQANNRGSIAQRPPNSDPRENKFLDRNLIQNRQGQRADQQRSQPPYKNAEFVAPGPQYHRQSNKSINRHNASNILGSENNKKPPQKMFQSQYGAGPRFGPGGFQQAQLPPNTLLGGGINNNKLNQSMMQQYPMMDTPIQPNRTSYMMIPNSEQQIPHLNNNQYYNQGQQQTMPYQGLPNINGQRPQMHDTPLVHQNMKQNYLNQGSSQQRPLPQQNQQQQQQQHISEFQNQEQFRREDILTPSPKMGSMVNNQGFVGHYNGIQNPTPFNQGENNTFYRPPNNEIAPQSEQKHPVGSIAVEPMFGNDYFADTRKFANASSLLTKGKSSIPGSIKDNGGQNNNYLGDDYRALSATSSQRTLRYNDFELIQKMAENDPAFKMHVDEGDEKDSSGAVTDQEDKKSASAAVQYPDIKMQKHQTTQKNLNNSVQHLYESKDNGNSILAKKASQHNHQQPPFSNQQRQSLPKMGLNQSIQQQKIDERERRHLNSNDTQLANHTINMNASSDQFASPNMNNQNSRRVVLPNNRIVQRSLPPANNRSKISIKQGIELQGLNKQSPRQNYKFVGKKKSNNRDGSNSNSRHRLEFSGVYAQNLKKPKLFEAKGVQKIALKNHLASLQQQQQHGSGHLKNLAQKGGNHQFNSEVFPSKKSSLGNMHDIRNLGGAGGGQAPFMSIDDRGDKHSSRFASHGRNDEHQSNFVIQHQSLVHNPHNNRDSLLPPMGPSQMQSQETRDTTNKAKRVWIPYNKKLKLKGIQQNMQGQSRGVHPQGSHGSGNPLLNSN